MEKKYVMEAKVPVYNQNMSYMTKTVKAGDLEEAKSIFKKQLAAEGYEVNEIGKKQSPIPAIVSFGIVILFSLFRYFNGFNSLEIFPDAKAVLFAIMLYSSFVVRVKGIKNTFKNSLDTILSLELVAVIAICIQILAGTGETLSNPLLNLLNTIKVSITNVYFLIFLAVFISWIGLKPVAGIVWILVLLSGLGEFSIAGKYMGNKLCIVFILAAFAGVIFYLRYEGHAITNSFKNAAVKATGFIKSDIASTQKLANQFVDAYVPGVLTGKTEIPANNGAENGMEVTNE